jgi:pimeloyl-ACP methyl ester carboxylesterase
MSVKLAFRASSDGPPLVILHSLFGLGHNWHTIADGLAANHRVFAVGLRLFLDEHDLERATVLGHSLGGKIAMLFALLYGHRVETLVVVDIIPVRYDCTHLVYVDALRGVRLEACRSRRDVDRQLARGVADPTLRAFLMQNLIS